MARVTAQAVCALGALFVVLGAVVRAQEASPQAFVAAQEVFVRDVRIYRGALDALRRTPTRYALQTYLEQTTILLQKKADVLRTWAASRKVARDADEARQLLLSDADDVFARAVGVRRHMGDAPTGEDLRAALAAVRETAAAYDKTRATLVRRVWRQRLTMVLEDADALLARLGDTSDAQLRRHLADLKEQRATLAQVRAQVDALPQDARMDDEAFGQLRARMEALAAEGGTWDAMGATLEAIAQRLNGRD